MENNKNKIDLFAESIIRRQFGIISALTVEPCDSDFNFEQAAILLTAIKGRFDCIIHKGVNDHANGGYAPICFTVLNNTVDRVSNRHWQQTMCSFARNNRQHGFIVGYDDVVLTDPLCSYGGQALVYGTIKMLETNDLPSRIAKRRARYTNQFGEIIASYDELLHSYGALLGGNSKIRFSVDEPFIKVDCVHKTQPYLTEKNTSTYYEKHKYFDSYYSRDYYSFACYPIAIAKAKELLRRLVDSS